MAFEFFDRIHSAIRPLYFAQQSVDHLFQSAIYYYCTVSPHYAVISARFHISKHRYSFCQYIRSILVAKRAANCTVAYGKPIDFRTKCFGRNRIPLNWC